MKKMTYGVVVGNRGFFPDKLAESGRKDILDVLKNQKYNTVCLTPQQTKFGTVESYDDARKCGELFKKNAAKIDGIIVTLPNFGDEKGVVNAIRSSGLDVPVLVQATPDEQDKMTLKDRRDSFCGKISVCNNLRQYGIPFTLTTLHTEEVDSEEFLEDLEEFAAVCRVVKGMRNARVGAMGARPAAFNTVRYSEKLLEEAGIAVETVDMYEIFGKCDELKSTDKAVQKKLADITKYVPCRGVPKKALMKMARFGVITDQWMKANDLNVTAVQCWTAMEEYFGITPCTVMSMMSNKLMPSACEVDVCGALSMYAMSLASGKPSALTDWNNNLGEDPDKCILFHCSNLPKAVFKEVKMDYQEIIAGTVGKANTYGTCVGRIKEGPFTYTRLTTDDSVGEIHAYTGEGLMTNDPLNTFGGYGVADIPGLQDLLEYICMEGFEHHVAINYGQVADAIEEAFANYFGWDTYLHS